ncbi:MAG: helix-turn-helix domain-containing protein [Veillonellaceae bacterium]|nr:helix-turn-helix domain-containing protein [Veillonellaceae bacterium]
MKKTILNNVFSTAEAAERWGMHADSVKQLCTGAQGRPPRLLVGEECKKSGGVWLVTRAGMERLYGKEQSKRNEV